MESSSKYSGVSVYVRSCSRAAYGDVPVHSGGRKHSVRHDNGYPEAAYDFRNVQQSCKSHGCERDRSGDGCADSHAVYSGVRGSLGTGFSYGDCGRQAGAE